MSLQSCKIYTSIFLLKIPTKTMSRKLFKKHFIYKHISAINSIIFLFYKDKSVVYLFMITWGMRWWGVGCEYFIVCKPLHVADQIISNIAQQNINYVGFTLNRQNHLILVILEISKFKANARMLELFGWKVSQLLKLPFWSGEERERGQGRREGSSLVRNCQCRKSNPGGSRSIERGEDYCVDCLVITTPWQSPAELWHIYHHHWEREEAKRWWSAGLIVL